jgi:hypothetical protein
VGLTLNDIRQLQVYDDNVNILGGRLSTVKENTEISIIARLV